ncbi:MAG: PD40 domain-containing protein [Anaerolineae bacterium]|nr:PD40 domain-containing protein [Anaerolineae bacterium]
MQVIKRLLYVVLIAACVLSTSAINAQGDEQKALNGAVGLLSKQLGISITVIDSFTAEPTQFEDTSFGCPVEGQTYVATAIQGFKFSIVYQGVTYDIRTNGDGTQGVLCQAPVVKETVGLATYRSPVFSIAYPETWNATDRNTDIFFGPSLGPVCAEPGMLVVVLGTVGDKTADALLDEYAAQSNLGLDPARTSIRNIGRSTSYVTKCADGSPRQARVTVFTAFGKGYRVVQFAPQPQFAAWADLYQQMLDKFSPSTLSANSGQPLIRPNVTPLASVAHVFAGNIFIATLTDWPGTPITSGATPDHSFRDPAISPLGDQVAFLDPAGKLYVTALSGKTQPLQIAMGAAGSYPLAWNPMGGEVAYVAVNGKDYALMAAKADGTGSRKIADMPAEEGSCSVETTDPAETLYWREAGIEGSRLLLAWSKDGSLFVTATCAGVSLLHIQPDGSSTKTDHIGRVSLSPDGTRLLGFQDTLVQIVIATGEVIPIELPAPADQAAWSNDGKQIYYSTLTVKTKIELSDEVDRERGEAQFGAWPFTSTVYTVTLQRLDLASGVAVAVFEGEGRGIGRITPAPDNSGVLFTFIQGDALLADSFANNVSAVELMRQYPSTLLYWLPLPTGTAQLVAMTSAPDWGPLGSALAPTPTGGYTPKPGKITLTPTPTSTPTIAPSLTPSATPLPRQALPTNTHVPG